MRLEELATLKELGQNANARLYLLTPRIFVAIAALGCLGLLSDAAIRFLSRRLGYRYQVTT